MDWSDADKYVEPRRGPRKLSHSSGSVNDLAIERARQSGAPGPRGASGSGGGPCGGDPSGPAPGGSICSFTRRTWGEALRPDRVELGPMTFEDRIRVWRCSEVKPSSRSGRCPKSGGGGGPCCRSHRQHALDRGCLIASRPPRQRRRRALGLLALRDSAGSGGLEKSRTRPNARPTQYGSVAAAASVTQDTLRGERSSIGSLQQRRVSV